MKKFLVIIAVLAMALFSTVAMAEVSVDGSVEFLMRSFNNIEDWNKNISSSGDLTLTYERIRFGINGKHEGVKGRIQVDTDWDIWADGTGNPGFETRTNGTFAIREGWIDFNIPGAGTAHVKVGRQFLQLGNGWFFQSRKYGSDAWLVGLPGKNTIAFVNVKAAENTSTQADDTDAYVLLDNFKIDDTKTVGAYIAHVTDRRGTWTNTAFGATTVNNTVLDNIGLWFNGKLGPVNLQAELDFQSGKIKHTAASGAPDNKLKGNQIVLQANIPMDALTFGATLASGSGNKAGSVDVDQQLNFLDKDPRYTLIYEYLMKTGANAKNTGFANTQAIGLNAAYKISKAFTVDGAIWMLTANEKVALGTGGGNTPSDKLGTEVDARVTWTIAEPLSWYVAVGYFATGDAYKSAPNADPNLNAKADAVTAVQSVLSYKF